MVDRGELVDLVGRWWWNYDAGNFDALESMLTDDVHFTCRTDTGRAEWEEFVRADIRGRDAVMEWQIEHRRNSPYPLRHNGTDLHVVEDRGDVATFASYIFVFHVVQGMPAPLPGGIVTGEVRRDESGLKIAALHVELDTVDSDLFAKVRG
jgi:SnoaL-like protein